MTITLRFILVKSGNLEACFDDRQDDVMKMPLYPTEELIWDPNLVPEEHYSGKVDSVLSHE